MQENETVLLIVEPSAEDRRSIRAIFDGRVDRILEAENPASAWEATRGLTQLTMMVAGFDAENGNDIFDLRDHLHKEIGFFPCAYCGSEPMTAFYPRVLSGERLFYKPVDSKVLLEWYAMVVAPPLNEPLDSVKAAATVPAERVEAPPSDQPLPEEALPVGTRLGDYKLLREFQHDDNFALYEAEQTSIGRHVALKILYRKHRKDIRWVQGFVDEASARASINHPSISLVYECDQFQGVNFYTLELVDAPSLADLARRRAELDSAVLWKVLHAASSALIYLRDQGMSHRLLSAPSILIVKGSEPRIANPVRGRGAPLSPEEERQQMHLLAEAIRPFLKKSVTDPGLFSLVERLGAERIDGIHTIEGLRRSLHPETKEGLSNAELVKITEKETNRTALVVGTLVGALIIAASAVAILMGGKPEVRQLETFIKIPAGKFPFQNGAEVELPEFWIGRYEVTIAEYAEFLSALAANPSLRARIKHPDEPADKVSYEPEKWSQYYAAALKGGNFLGGAIDPSCPVVGVDFWDAHAYASWRGGRLPTEEEWEKAARGRSGSVYPWGDTLESQNFNSGLDHETKDGIPAGSLDGYKYWNPVDAIAADESRYGVVGMAGNVSEWTATWGVHPDDPDRRVPLKRGASFSTTAGFELVSRRAAESPSDRNYLTGFRIAADRENPVRLSPGGNAPATPASAPQP